jgi:hypothetical protein
LEEGKRLPISILPIFDMSWDFPGNFFPGWVDSANNVNIGTVAGYYTLGTSGTYELTWYILDKSGNKSQVITRTITVN